MKTGKIPPQLLDILRGDSGNWTPQCPEPETLLDWVEQGEAYPRQAELLTHILRCAYCRREYVDLSEIRMLTRMGEPQPLPPLARFARWLDEIKTTGWVMPLEAIRELLNGLPTRTVAIEATRGEAPALVAPVATAIRTAQPRLQWEAVRYAQFYTVTVLQQNDSQGTSLVHQKQVGRQTEYQLPLEAGMEPGKSYLWQVAASVGDDTAPSPSAGFLVLSEVLQREVEHFESVAASSLVAKIGVCEAYGLYEEAFQLTQQMKGGDAEISVIRAQLLRHREG